ncbi:hypothetical protein EON82_16290 [bacterium]|nr:MAG: hypothetical protein EON82_16290 [bacterium]
MDQNEKRQAAAYEAAMNLITENQIVPEVMFQLLRMMVAVNGADTMRQKVNESIEDFRTEFEQTDRRHRCRSHAVVPESCLPKGRRRSPRA